MKKLLFLALLLLTIGAEREIFAQDLEENCAISATVTDKDPNGLNVRSKPKTGGKIIATLKRGSDETLKVYVIGYSNGWVKIGGAYKDDGKGTIFQDSGWVSAKMLAVTAGENAEIYQKPDAASKVIAKVPGGTIFQIAGYNCGDVKVVYKGKTGWLRAIVQ